VVAVPASQHKIIGDIYASHLKVGT